MLPAVLMLYEEGASGPVGSGTRSHAGVRACMCGGQKLTSDSLPLEPVALVFEAEALATT